MLGQRPATYKELEILGARLSRQIKAARIKATRKVSSFTGLLETPGTLAGTAGQFLKTNDDESALEFTDALGFGDLTDPDADRILFWDDSEDALKWLSADDSTIEINAAILRVKDSGVTYAKIQNVSASGRVLGRKTAGAGVVEEITPANVLAMLSGQAGAAFDWSAQDLTGVGDVQVGDGKYVGVSGDARIEYDSTNHYLEVKGGDFFTDRWLSQYTNTFFGVGVVGAGNLAHTTGDEGYHNSAFGYYSLYSNTTGYYNSAFGYQSLLFNTTGYHNSAFGFQSLYDNTEGYHNSAVGYYSLRANTEGYRNSAFGFQSLRFNTTGYHNSAFGMYSLRANTTGYYNSAFGYQSLYNVNPTAAGEGVGNIGIGYQAGLNLTTAKECIIIGYNLDAKSATADYQLSIGDIYRGHINDGEAYIACPSAICGDADLANSEVSFAVDEVNHELDIKVKYSDGSVKSGVVSLS